MAGTTMVRESLWAWGLPDSRSGRNTEEPPVSPLKAYGTTGQFKVTERILSITLFGKVLGLRRCLYGASTYKQFPQQVVVSGLATFHP